MYQSQRSALRVRSEETSVHTTGPFDNDRPDSEGASLNSCWTGLTATMGGRLTSTRRGGRHGRSRRVVTVGHGAGSWESVSRPSGISEAVVARWVLVEPAVSVGVLHHLEYVPAHNGHHADNHGPKRQVADSELGCRTGPPLVHSGEEHTNTGDARHENRHPRTASVEVDGRTDPEGQTVDGQTAIEDVVAVHTCRCEHSSIISSAARSTVTEGGFVVGQGQHGVSRVRGDGEVSTTLSSGRDRASGVGLPLSVQVAREETPPERGVRGVSLPLVTLAIT